MSASSSTMRISAAMPLSAHFVLLFGFGVTRMAGGGETNTQPGPALPGDFIGGVVQFDAAAMVLNDTADDGEPQPGALFACRDIRFEQPAAVFLRQTDAVIDHIDDDVVAFARGEDLDRALAEF